VTIRILQGAALALAVGAVSSSLTFVLSPLPALALDVRQAEAVVSVMEVLTSDMGEGMMTDAADIFYDYDLLGAELIAAAGFDRAGWIEAYDAVAAGYMATIPQDEFDAIFEEPLAMLESSALPEDQKVMMREHVNGLVAEAQTVREGGMAYADTVRPFENRLYPLFFGSFGE